MKRRFEFSEGGSQKFWEIEQAGSSFTVCYGRLGTAGQSKTTQCPSADEATADVAKLIREKTKKGYQEIGGGERNWRPPTSYSPSEHPKHFMNFAVSVFNPDVEADAGEGDDGFKTYPTLRDAERRAYAIRLTWDDEDATAEDRMEALLDDPKSPLLKGLIIGSWFVEVCDNPPTDIIEMILEQPESLAGLVGLFAGDIIQEEAELSWIHQCDWAPVLHVLPNLEEFIVRGGQDLRLKRLRHANLKSLTLQSGGLSGDVVRDVAKADLPELRTLALWLGTESYGASFTLKDLAPILAGKVFPKLEYLGLMNAQNADDIAEAVAKAPILGRLKGLDLSMGTLGDRGGLALLQSPLVKGLKYLNLRRHYLSPDVEQQFRKLGIEVNVSDRESDDEDDRYCEFTE